MKTITRILIILLAALTVVGATWAVGAGSSDSSATVERRGDFDRDEGLPPRPEGEAGFDRDGSQVLSIRGWLGFLETLVPISIIITVVTLATNWNRRRHAQQRASAAAPV